MALATPEEHPRFGLVRLALLEATSILVRSGDERGNALLQRYPSLADGFSDSVSGRLRPDRGGFAHHKWVRWNGHDLVVY